jgi:hypothetical protein
MIIVFILYAELSGSLRAFILGLADPSPCAIENVPCEEHVAFSLQGLWMLFIETSRFPAFWPTITVFVITLFLGITSKVSGK